MMKRTLSFLLCLIMVLSLAAPCVQASSGDNAYTLDDYVYTSDSTMDNVVIKNNAGANIVYDDNVIISQDTDTTLTNPADLITEPTTLSATVVEKVCQCADLASAVDHPGVCLVKAPYMKLCETTAQELFALWGIYTAEEQEYIREYLQNKYPAKYNEFLDILAAPHSSASETLADGTVVSVEGIPEYSSLTVGQTSDEVKDIVNDYVAQKEDGSRELFGYDVSVQDSDGADWQPDETVKMELELPGKKLHKNTQVYVVHVDDNGVATTIKASVNEEGKIVFETPGFSAFYGFTVDFDYEGVSFCIPGMTSIELSELMENLNMPLDAKDVVNVEYTDETQLTITKLEGDWLITSLKEFTTEERLTLTMADGSVYHIKVTDDITGKRATFEMTLQNGTYYRNVDANSNGVVQLYLDNTGRPSSDDWNTYSDQYNDWLTQPLEIDGLKGDDATGGTIEIVLQKKSSYTGTDCVLKILCLKIYGDANVIIRLGNTFSGNDTVRITRSWEWVAGNGWKKERALIDIYNGSLFFNINSEVSDTNDDIEEAKKTLAAGADLTSHNNSKERKIILDGGHTTDHSRMTKQAPIIYCGLKAKKLMINNTIFRNNGFRGIYVLATEMSVFRIRDSEFESSVHYLNGGGGAIRFEKTCTNADLNEDFGYSKGGETSTEVVDMKDLDLIGVKFNGNSTATAEGTGGDGGAFQILANPESIDMVDCEFVNCHANSHGGAIALSGAGGSADISIKDCTFTGCNANARGGAIYHDGIQTTTTFTVQGCTFTSCTAGTYGGAIAIYGQTTTTNINENSFSNCSAGSIEKVYESGSTTEQAKDAYGNLKYNGNGGGGGILITGKHVNVNIKGTASKKQSFSNCYTYNNGGAIGFEGTPCDITGTVTLDYLDIDGCQARDSGSAISLTTVQIQTMIFSNSIVQNCSYSKNRSNAYENSLAAKDKKGNVQTEETPFEDMVFLTQDAGGTFRTTGATRTQLTISSVTFKKNTAHNGGAGVYWNANRVAPVDSETPCTWKPSLSITGCTFENNNGLRDGGGVYVEASLSLTNCSFTGNIANRGGAIAQQIYNQSGRPIQDGESNALTLDSNTTISNNYARTHGGGISIICNATSSITTPMAYPITFTLGGASVTGNRAAQNGGGIYFNQESYEAGTLDQQMVEKYIKICTLDSGTISGNYAGYGLTNLKAATAAPTGSGHGGGIYIQVEKNATLDIMGATIQSNTAHEGNGGGVYMTGTDGKCTVKKNAAGTVSTIGGAANKGNVATSANNNNNQGNGGGLAIFGGATIELHYGTVSYNSADTAGGGIAINHAKVTAEGGTVSHNKAQYGGGISLANSGDPASFDNANVTTKWGMEFTNGTVSDNVASLLGGGICLSNKSTMTLSGGLVSNNYAANAVTVNGKTTYTYSKTNEGGGIAVCQDSRMAISGGVVKENHAYYGGGFTVRGNSDVTMTGSLNIVNGQVNEATATGVIRDNYAYQDGGGVYLGVYVGNDVNHFTMNNGWIYANEAEKAAGGGVFVGQYNGFYLNGGMIQDNECSTKGGGVYVYYGVVEITNGFIKGNKAKVNNGGGICAETRCTVKVSGGTIESNTAQQSGGGIYASGSSKVTVSNGIIQNNTATANGGGIYCHSGTLKLTGNASKYGSILNNKSPKGNAGGIYVESASEFLVEYMKLEGNIGMYGGGIFMKDISNATIKGGSFSKNYSNQGAGLFIRACKILITGGEFTWNVAGPSPKYDDGTLWYTNDSYGSQYGGGLLVDDLSDSIECQVTIEGGTFSHNTAPQGGGIWIKNISSSNKSAYCPTVTMTGGSITYNTASKYGGGVCVDGNGYADDTYQTKFTIKGGDISYNTANGFGGGIYATGKAVVQVLEDASTNTHGTISYNQAHCGGGIGVSYGANLTVNNGYIVYNNAFVPQNPANTPASTGYQALDKLYGAGGGIFVATGSSSSAVSTFTLDGTEMAIYGNTADFSGDDVFSNGSNTRLNMPKVDEMNLTGYGFNAVGWVEDYNPNDSNYNNSYALRMFTANNAPSELKHQRYRNANGVQRTYALIKTNNGGNNYVEGATSATYTYVNKKNAYVAMTLGIPGVEDDTVVVDFSHNFSVSLIDNDPFINEDDFKNTGELGLVMPDGLSMKDGIYYSSGKEGADHKGTFYGKQPGSYRWKFGTGVMSDDGKLSYDIGYNKSSLAFSSIDQMVYTVKHGDYWFYGKVTIVPATTIYFEDTDSPITYYETATYDVLAQWDQVGSYSQKDQDQDRPGSAIIQDTDADNVYGYDSSYSDNTAYSYGCAHKVTVNRHNAVDADYNGLCDTCGRSMLHDWKDTNKDGKCDECYLADPCKHNCKDTNKDGKCDKCKRQIKHTCVDNVPRMYYCDICGKSTMSHTTNARASFVFTGTGFDIISYCSKNTGLVMVNVYEGKDNIVFEDNPDTDAFEATMPVACYMVDTYFSNEKLGLYQVPVIKADLTKEPKYDENWNQTGYLGYGTYTVEIYVAPSFHSTEHAYNGAEFYLDAIRIYNPANIGDSIDSTILNAYKEDNEAWPAYAEVRNMLISQHYDPDKPDDQQTNVKVNGMLFVDGQGSTSKITDYVSWGPNNEVYLKTNESIAFTLDMSAYGQNVAGIHLGARSLTGGPGGKVLVEAGTSSTDKATILNNQSLSTADMYYNIGKKDSNGNFIAAGKTITITNKGTYPIAITNIKVTHSTKPTNKGSLTGLFKATLNTAYAALDILSTDPLGDPVVSPKYPALSFNGMVCYNVFFSAEDLGLLSEADLGLAVFDSYDPEGTIGSAKDVIYGATENDGIYMIATNGVHAKYLGDTQYFKVFARMLDGTYVYSKMVSYSALDYAKNVLAKSDDVKLKQLVVAMLNYGAEAQKFFGYKTDDLMNKDLTADDQALLTGFSADSLNGIVKADPAKVGAFASTGGFTRKSPAISFKGAFEINYFFTPSNAVDGDMTLYFWNEDTYNSVAELTAENADKAVTMKLEDGAYTASSDEIIAKNLDKTLYVAAVYTSGGQTYCSGVLPYSIAAYCQKPPAGVQDLAAAAAVYGCTAKEFFGA